MNPTSKISLREYLILLSLGLMPPILKLIPFSEAQTAGAAGWLAPIVALPFFLLGVWLVWQAGKRLPENAGLGEALCLWLGRPLGRLLCMVCGIWLMLFVCVALRFCAERFTSTIYPETGMGLFFLVILGLEWYLGRRKLTVTARAGQIFFYVMLMTLGVVLALGITGVKSYHLLPIRWSDAPAVAKSATPLLYAMTTALGWLFLFGEVTRREKGLIHGIVWVSLMTLFMLILGLVVMGAFGAPMVQRLQIPFFSLAKELHIGNAVQRVEPLVVTMWVYADIISTALLLRSAERAFQTAFQVTGSLNGALLTIALPGAYLLAGSFFGLDNLYQRLLAPVELVLFLLAPLTAFLIGKLRKKA